MSSQIAIEQISPRRQLKLWPLVTLPLSALAAWAINAGGEALRWVGLGAIAWSLALPLLVSLEAGLFAMMLFEPLRGFLRRAQYLFLPYSATDPIHLVTPLVTLLAFAMLLQRKKLRVFRGLPLTGMVSILALIYILEIFNPLDGRARNSHFALWSLPARVWLSKFRTVLDRQHRVLQLDPGWRGEARACYLQQRRRMGPLH